MQYSIVLDPAMTISPEEFVSEWDQLAESKTVGEARLREAEQTTYDPTLIHEIAVGLFVNVSSSVLFEAIRSAIAKKKDVPREKIQIIEQTKPDGSHLLVVTMERE